ncbi:MAG: hypothetical protein JWQ53_3161 [Klenkia sp.]|nr:hypothetical protein [Klenkia sp.]
MDPGTHDDQGREIASPEGVAPQPGNAHPQELGVVVCDEHGNRTVEPLAVPAAPTP